MGIASLVVVFMLIANSVVESESEGKTYSSIESIPKHRVGLLLGTAKYLRKGGVNPYFQYRIQAAVQLFESGKIDFLLVSGDNSHKSYNEPMVFKKELMKNGIPESCIFLDFAGFSTLDSVVRAKEVFGQDSFIVISQEFHNERALYLAGHHGIQAIGFNATDLAASLGLKVQIREYFARSKAVIDILLDRQPKFLGDPITIE